ncbi:MAG: hypothetical protein IK016_03085 [Lachnospiraceae bacterium]|nr:hypothetical protein [Lachnospiraceae bacterium]
MAQIVQINEQNIAYFIPMLPAYLLEELEADPDMLLFGVESEELAAGVCAAVVTAPQAEILWFYLAQPFRGTGIALEGFSELLCELQRSYGIRVVTADLPAGECDAMRRLLSTFPVTYTKLPAGRYETTVGRMRDAKKLSHASRNSVALSKLSGGKLRSLCNELGNAGNDLVPLPFPAELYTPELSAVYMEQNRPTAVLLVKDRGAHVEIPFFASLSSDPKALADVMYFVRERMEGFDAEMPLIMNLAGQRFLKLVRSLLELKEEDETGFVRNVRAGIDLSFLQESERETADWLETCGEIAAIMKGGSAAGAEAAPDAKGQRTTTKKENGTTKKKENGAAKKKESNATKKKESDTTKRGKKQKA